MTDYYVYDANGKVLRSGVCPRPDLASQAGGGETAGIGVADDNGQYIPDVNDPVLTAKLVNTTVIDLTTVVADGVAIVTLSSMPTDPTVIVKGEGVYLSEDVVGTTEAINFDLAGDYTVCVQVFPYIDYEVVVTAT